MESVSDRPVASEQPSVFSDLSAFPELSFLSKEPKKSTKVPTKLAVSLRNVVDSEKNRTGEIAIDALKSAIRVAVAKEQKK